MEPRRGPRSDTGGVRASGRQLHAAAGGDCPRSQRPGESPGIRRRGHGDREGGGVSRSADVMSTGGQRPMYEWETLPWRELERGVFKLQKRIYRASCRGDRKVVRRLQRLPTTSRAAKLLAVRRVTQDNRGKATAGVDGVKNLPAPERPALADSLALHGKADPVR